MPKSSRPSFNSSGCNTPSPCVSNFSKMAFSWDSDKDCNESSSFNTCLNLPSICSACNSTSAHTAAPRTTAPSRCSSKSTLQSFAAAASSVWTNFGRKALARSPPDSLAVRPVGTTSNSSKTSIELTTVARCPSTRLVHASHELQPGSGGAKGLRAKDCASVCSDSRVLTCAGQGWMLSVSAVSAGLSPKSTAVWHQSSRRIRRPLLKSTDPKFFPSVHTSTARSRQSS
mmetsp:Transcript_64404/g.179070  ORF Transcript_64404/g.179070 Transcript_64404/m.179070 type:complete len:229 (+) Transcript_64404:438-1124(+)